MCLTNRIRLPQSLVISQLKDVSISRENCLSGDILWKVASFITNYNDLVNFRAVAVDWRKTANDPRLWIKHLPFPSLKVCVQLLDFEEKRFNLLIMNT